MCYRRPIAPGRDLLANLSVIAALVVLVPSPGQAERASLPSGDAVLHPSVLPTAVVLALVGVSILLVRLLCRYRGGAAARQDALERATAQLERQADPRGTKARRSGALNAALEARVEEVQALNERLRALNEELVSLGVAADSAREAAERANRAKSDFLAVVSHELRTPLNAIAGYVDLLEVGVYGAPNEEQSRALERIRRNQRYLLGLINDILHFATLEAGKLEIRAAELGVAAVLGDVGEMVAVPADRKGLDCVLLPCDPELRVRADHERLVQILTNLLVNAIKFTPSQGRVSLRVEAREERVAFVVEDTGPGIPAERLAAIFEPFVQLRGCEVDDPSRQGVGLGLAISRELTRAMDGELSAESVEGRGSTFTVTLPRGGRIPIYGVVGGATPLAG